MSVIRVNKTSDFTVMSNYHFRDKSLSLKAKGLLSQMLSLPENWDYTISGLASINKENKTAIQSALHELEKGGYLVRTRTQDESGRFDYIYDIYEKPRTENLCTENQHTESPCTENNAQLNTYKENTEDKLLNNKKLRERSATRFTPPTVQEVRDYCQERNNNVDAERFVDFYAAKGWKIGSSPMKDWKAAVRTWEKRDADNKPKAQHKSSQLDPEYIKELESLTNK